MINLLPGIPVMYCLLEVVSVCPEKLASKFVDQIDWIKVSMHIQLSFLYPKTTNPVTYFHN